PVPADARGAGQRGGGAGGHACPGPDRRASAGWAPGCGAGGAVGGLTRVLPPGRRQWAEAVEAEAGEVAAGWPRLHWLAGGLWLVAREAKMARKVVYWLGAGIVAAVGVWVVWLSWQTSAAADPQTVTDRVRVLVGAAALVVLPWVGRRGGW